MSFNIQQLREEKRAFASDARNDGTDYILILMMGHGCADGSTYLQLRNLNNPDLQNCYCESLDEFGQLYDVYEGCVTNLSREDSRIKYKPKILVISCCRGNIKLISHSLHFLVMGSL